MPNYTWNSYLAFTVFAVVIVVVAIIVIAILAGTGVLTVNSENQMGSPLTDVAVGKEASFSPTIQNKVWTKVFDSNNGCFIDLMFKDLISTSTVKKLNTYIINEGLKPLDNPFKGVVEVPVLNCGEDDVMLITLDLSNFNNTNPFKLNDLVYIYGVAGVVNANNPTDPDTMNTQKRYIAETAVENPSLNYNQIKIKLNKYSVDILASEGLYTGGGTVRLVLGASLSMFYNVPEFMFYIYMSTINKPFLWPFIPKSSSEVYSTIYSKYFNDYINWVGKLKPTCTVILPGDLTVGPEPKPEPDFENGPVTVTTEDGFGSGMVVNYIKSNIYGESSSYYLVTNDGIGYKTGNGDGEGVKLTVSQGTITGIVTAYIGCYENSYYRFLYDKLMLPLTTTPTQLKRFINKALDLEPAINTISIITNNPPHVPDIYENPNFMIQFNITSQSSEFNSQSGKITSNFFGICPQPDTCSIQTIYTSSDGNSPIGGTIGGAGGVGGASIDPSLPYNFMLESPVILNGCVPLVNAEW